MSNDNRPFFDFVSIVERKFDEAALAVRESLATATWLPPSARPSAPAVPVRIIPVAPPRLKYSGNLIQRSYARTFDWVMDHQAIAAATLAFVVTGGVLMYSQRRNYLRKRRARRGINGARKEVVVIACTCNAPVPRSIILDLERRGFVVYVVVNSALEEEVVRAENKADILPLHLGVTDPLDVQATLSHFTTFFTEAPTTKVYAAHQIPTPSTTTSKSAPDTEPLRLAGIILIPDLHYPTGPLEATPLDLWTDTLNTRLLLTVALAQSFIPLLCTTQSRLIILNPTTSSSLTPAFHTMQSCITASLSAFAASLRSELATLSPRIPVTEIRLGALLDGIAASAGARSGTALQRSARTEVMEWEADARTKYARNYISMRATVAERGGFTLLGLRRKGSWGELRQLHNCIFDALVVGQQGRFGVRALGLGLGIFGGPSAVYRVGRGSLVHEIVGRWAPIGLVDWMMGVKRV